MPAKRYNTGNTVKKLCVYAMLCAVCIVIGYIESLFELSFIAPGIKPGLANAVACVLIFYGDIKGAFAVNISRILLSNLLFSYPGALPFALAGGVLSLALMALLSKNRHVSVFGGSIAGGAVHNAAQCAVGVWLTGWGVVYYLPILLITGMISGAAVGALSSLILKRVKKGEKYV
ncbi:MAG: Gx transporter family protein [Clostridia bacterium]|nr:Gx transporter family protein [Clostridia bacterium]